MACIVLNPDPNLERFILSRVSDVSLLPFVFGSLLPYTFCLAQVIRTLQFTSSQFSPLPLLLPLLSECYRFAV